MCSDTDIRTGGGTASVLGSVSYANAKNFEEENQLNILLLNSYHDGYVWSNDTKTGVKDVLTCILIITKCV